MDKIIEVSGLHKSYGHVHAVRGIDFYVERGGLFAFLGPNGAGKTTTINIICTLLRQDGGEVIVDGNRLPQQDARVRDVIGVVFQDNLLDPLLTVRENLSVRAKLYPKARGGVRSAVERAARIAEAAEFLDRPYGKLSGGQRRRADIARALVHTPKILILDEPTTGLDPQTRQSVWHTISELQKQEGMTVFLTTHYMEEAAAADYIMIIDYGKIAEKGSPSELKQRHAFDSLRIRPRDPSALLAMLRGKQAVFSENNGLFIVNLSSTRDALPLLAEGGDFIESFEVLHGTMDDVFLHVTGREMREDA